MIIHTDDLGFEKVVKNGKLCLVDFFATWCAPCRMLGQELVDLDNENLDFDIVKVDIDNSPELSNKYNIEVVPTMLVFKNGEMVKQVQGYMQKDDLKNMMEQFK